MCHLCSLRGKIPNEDTHKSDLLGKVGREPKAAGEALDGDEGLTPQQRTKSLTRPLDSENTINGTGEIAQM